eukprot:13437128-Ditylum_brightwellii.AAC.1
MVQKAIDFVSIAETFCSPIPLPGMLKVVETEHFGKISLLRFLMAIKATPAQAEAANEESDKKAPPSKDDSDADLGVDSSEEGFITVSTKKKNPSKRSLEEADEKSLSSERPGA